jgi:hypothetical protein
MNELNTVIALSGIAVLSVRGNKVVITQYDQKVSFNKDDAKQGMKLELKDMLLEFKGKRNCVINSDVFNVTNQKIKIRNLEKHTLQRILDKVITKSISYLSKVSEEENTDIVIQTEYDGNNSALTVTVGLVGDIQVLLLDIHYERNERSIKC